MVCIPIPKARKTQLHNHVIDGCLSTPVLAQNPLSKGFINIQPHRDRLITEIYRLLCLGNLEYVSPPRQWYKSRFPCLYPSVDNSSFYFQALCSDVKDTGRSEWCIHDRRCRWKRLHQSIKLRNLAHYTENFFREQWRLRTSSSALYQLCMLRAHIKLTSGLKILL